MISTRENPTISISLPVRGQAHFLPTALQSLRAQRAPFSLAVLDATPDDSVQRVTRDFDDLIDYRYHRPDEGQAAAIRHGWECLPGDVLGWLNADDYYFPETLSIVHDVFRNRPDADVVFGHAVHVSETGEFLTYFPAIHPDPRRLALSCTICQPSCFVRRSAVEQVGGIDPTLQFAMDWDLWSRLHRAGAKFQFVDELLSAVRVYPETKTLKGSQRRYRELSAILRANGVSRWRRLPALARFRCGDWLQRRPRPLVQSLYGIVAKTSTYGLSGTAKNGLPVCGLAPWTNEVVDGCCEVRIPWYQGSRRRRFELVADRPIGLSMTINGRPIAVERPTAEPRVSGHVYASEPAEICDGTLVVSLKSDCGPWRLLSLAAQERR